MMRAVVLGLGPQGQRLMKALSLVEGLRLDGVCDRRPEALNAVPVEIRRFSDAEEAFRSGPDVAIIATNGSSHRDLVHQAIEAGVRKILCEKPIACSVPHAREMVERAREAHLVVNHCRRVVPAYRWLSEQVRSGEWGVLRGMSVTCPGIGLGNLGTHFLDLMRFLSGDEFSEVTGWIDPERAPNFRGAQFHDPGGLIVATGRSGVRFVLRQIEDACGPHQLTLDLTGARIRIEETRSQVEVIVRGAPGEERHKSLEVPMDRPMDLDMVRMSADVLRDLVKGPPFSCDAEHGLRSLEALVAAYASDRAGHRPIPLPCDDPMELPIT